MFQGDVLMKFDGVPVANEGTVPFQAGERIAFTFLASQKYVPVLVIYIATQLSWKTSNLQKSQLTPAKFCI